MGHLQITAINLKRFPYTAFQTSIANTVPSQQWPTSIEVQLFLDLEVATIRRFDHIFFLKLFQVWDKVHYHI